MSWIGVLKRITCASLMMGLLAIVGCSETPSPVSSSESQLSDASSASALLRFGAGGQPAAKSMGDDDDDDGDDDDGDDDDGDGDDVAVDDYENGFTTSAIIGPKGGKLKIKDKGPKKDEDGSKLHAALSVELKIPKDALDVEEEISMRVSGYFLSELIIAFAPGGLDFAEDARLKIRLERDRVDLDAATLYGVHTTHTGETEVVLVEVEAKGSGDVILNVRVPGFSRYSLGE